jgi:transposase
VVQEVKMAHPLLVKLMSSARVKTDTRDTLHLARLLAAGLIPTVGVPPAPVRELRVLVAQRQRLVRQRTQSATRLHRVLPAHQIPPPAGRLGAAGQQTWWEQLELPTSERVRVVQDLPLLQTVERLIVTVAAELTRLSTQDPWKELAALLAHAAHSRPLDGYT